MSTKSPKSIIVVGGSLAGLMTGLALKRLGHHVRIFERSPSTLLQSQGAGIVFGPEAQEYFRKNIDGYINRSLTVTSYLRQTLGRDGQQVSEDKRQQKMVSWDLLYFVLRACFDGLEAEYCAVPKGLEGDGEVGYEYGRKVVALRDLGKRVEIESEVDGGEKEKDTVDFVVAADGPSSTVRRLLLPKVKRIYAGYVAWRGTVPESEASSILQETFIDHFTFYHGPGIQILAYLIPAEKGTTEPGKRLINWVWYCNYAPNSPEHIELMTDTSGHHHHFTMPVGEMQPHLWTDQKSYATKVLPPAFAELVNKTQHPFVQAITDVISPECSFLNGKVLLVGDAVAGFRPHTAASTSQAAFHGLLLDKAMKGEIGWKEMKATMVEYARRMVASGIKMGDRSQFESLQGMYDQVSYEKTKEFRDAKGNLHTK